MPDVNLGVVIATLAPVLALLGYLVKPVVDANRDLRSTIAGLREENEQQREQIRFLEGLITVRRSGQDISRRRTLSRQ